MIGTAGAILAGCVGGVLLLARLLDGDRLDGAGTSAFYLVLLSAFYPLFCLLTGPMEALPRHALIALACSLLALLALRTGFGPVILGFAAQGVLNVVTGLGAHPGHPLWPAFAAPFAVTLAVGLTLLTRDDRSIR